VTTQRATARAGRRRRNRVDQAHAEVLNALQPVTEALRALTEQQAAKELADAAESAALVVRTAQWEAAVLLAAARANGKAAGERIRANMLALARRQSREMILGAQREAFEALRVAAQDKLVEQAASELGRELTRLIDRSVCERVASPIASHPTELGPLGALAERANLRAALGTRALIDAALERMPRAIEALWA
jgi:hypothetical protein